MNLRDTFAILKPDMSVETLQVSPQIYEELDDKFDSFRSHVLISSYVFDTDWKTWERHPAGDEVVVLMSGSAKIALQKDTGQECFELHEPGSCIVIPRNIWHTAFVSEPTTLLFITPGEGTQNRPGPDV